jgi:uncharacterized protein (TIGR03086 family)
MTETDAIIGSNQLFDKYVQLVRDDQWDLPTANADWNVHQLVNHLVNEDSWLVELLAGRTIAEVGAKYDGDLLGDDPKGVWAKATAAAQSAARELPDTSRLVHLSFGDVPATVYLQQMTIDHVIHAWDLAHAIGADEHLDEALVRAAYDWFSPQAEGWRGAGILGPAIPVPEDADLQTKLLAISGRRSVPTIK